jgi:hypothetical protein
MILFYFSIMLKETVIKSLKKYSFIKDNNFECIFSTIKEALNFITRENAFDARFNKEKTGEIILAQDDVFLVSYF